MWHHSIVWHHSALSRHSMLHSGHESHWMGHTIVSSLIHGLIFGAIFRLFSHMSLGAVLTLAVLGVAIVAGIWWWWARRSEDQ